MLRIILASACITAASAMLPAAAPAGWLATTSATVRRTVVDTISVPGMQCESCEKRITKKLKGVKGVSAVVANADRKQVVVTYHPDQTDRQTLEQRIAESGYDTGSVVATDAAKNALPSCCRVKE